MAAAVQLMPMNKLGKNPLRPTARRGHNFPGEYAASHRKFDAAALALANDSRVLEVNACRRRRRVRQPVESDVVEHLVPAERRFGIARVVGPGVEFLVDPGGLARR